MQVKVNLDFTDKFLVGYSDLLSSCAVSYRKPRRAKHYFKRNALLSRLCCLVVALCFFASTTSFAGASARFLADHPETTQCSVDVLTNCERTNSSGEIEAFESFELEERDCVNRTSELPLDNERSMRLPDLAQSTHIDHISEPHLRPPRPFSISV